MALIALAVDINYVDIGIVAIAVLAMIIGFARGASKSLQSGCMGKLITFALSVGLAIVLAFGMGSVKSILSDISQFGTIEETIVENIESSNALLAAKASYAEDKLVITTESGTSTPSAALISKEVSTVDDFISKICTEEKLKAYEEAGNNPTIGRALGEFAAKAVGFLAIFIAALILFTVINLIVGKLLVNKRDESRDVRTADRIVGIFTGLIVAAIFIGILSVAVYFVGDQIPDVDLKTIYAEGTIGGEIWKLMEELFGGA